MKIIGIHGRGSQPNKPWGTWEVRINDLHTRWYDIDLPQFDCCEDPTYESWEVEMKQIDIESYDVVVTSSHWWGVFGKYVKDNDLNLKRVVFCAPWRWSTGRINTWKLYDYLESHEMNLENNIDEIFIVHSKDDEVVPYSEWVKFQKQIWGKLITLEWLPHKLDWEWVKIINDLATLWHIHKK